MGRGSTGPITDHVYAIGSELTAGDLLTRADPENPDRHVFVEPRRSMATETYEIAIAKTRPHWRKAWP